MNLADEKLPLAYSAIPTWQQVPFPGVRNQLAPVRKEFQGSDQGQYD